MNFKIICQECGAEVMTNQKHTYQDCLIEKAYQKKISQEELLKKLKKLNEAGK